MNTISSSIARETKFEQNAARAYVLEWHKDITTHQDAVLKTIIADLSKHADYGRITSPEVDPETSDSALNLFAIIVLLDKTLLDQSNSPEDVVTKFSEHYPLLSKAIKAVLKEGESLESDGLDEDFQKMRDAQDGIYKAVIKITGANSGLFHSTLTDEEKLDAVRRLFAAKFACLPVPAPTQQQQRSMAATY
jgi:hypothetical protein